MPQGARDPPAATQDTHRTPSEQSAPPSARAPPVRGAPGKPVRRGLIRLITGESGQGDIGSFEVHTTPRAPTLMRLHPR